MTQRRGQLTRKSLSTIEIDAELPEERFFDARAAEARQLNADEPLALAAIAEVFAGTDLPADRDKVALILSIRREVRSAWGEARDRFLAIGRALVLAEERLTRFEFERLRKGSERLFPFSDGVASQLRRVARAVDSGRLPQEQCPGSYATAYQLAVLHDDELQQAKARNLVRADVTRGELLAFRRELRHQGANANRLGKAFLRAEWRRLTGRREQLRSELAEVAKRIAEIEGLLKDGQD